VRARKIRYYDDPAFATRLLKPLAIPELVVERVQPRRFETGPKPEAVHEVLSELQALLRESSTPPAARR